MAVSYFLGAASSWVITYMHMVSCFWLLNKNSTLSFWFSVGKLSFSSIFKIFSLCLVCQFKGYTSMCFQELMLRISWNLCRFIPLTKLRKLLSLMFSNPLFKTILSLSSFCWLKKKHYWVLNIFCLSSMSSLDFCWLLWKYPFWFYMYLLKILVIQKADLQNI